MSSWNTKYFPDNLVFAPPYEVISDIIAAVRERIALLRLLGYEKSGVNLDLAEQIIPPPEILTYQDYSAIFVSNTDIVYADPFTTYGSIWDRIVDALQLICVRGPVWQDWRVFEDEQAYIPGGIYPSNFGGSPGYPVPYRNFPVQYALDLYQFLNRMTCLEAYWIDFSYKEWRTDSENSLTAAYEALGGEPSSEGIGYFTNNMTMYERDVYGDGETRYSAEHDTVKYHKSTPFYGDTEYENPPDSLSSRKCMYWYLSAPPFNDSSRKGIFNDMGTGLKEGRNAVPFDFDYVPPTSPEGVTFNGDGDAKTYKGFAIEPHVVYDFSDVLEYKALPES